MGKNSISSLMVHLLTVAILAVVCVFSLYHYLQSDTFGFFTVETTPTTENVIFPPESKLLKNNSLMARFKGTLPHLGIVSIRFNTFDRINNDTLRFKITNEDISEWYYEGSYKTDQFQPNKLFPFGFPEIPNSEGKTFVIILTSESGSPSSSVAIGRDLPIITTRYVLDLSTLKQRPILLFRFIWHKAANLISDLRLISYLMISFLPLCLYQLTYKKIKNKFGLFTFVVFGVLVGLPRIVPQPVVEIFSAIAVISLVILTITFIQKIIRYNRKNV